MNKEQAKAWLPLIQAMAEGKTLQSQHIHRLMGNQSITWNDIRFLPESLAAYDVAMFRIKPELSQESLKMANYLEEMAKSIRQMKIQPHDITNTAIASGCGTYREVTFIYTEKA